VLLEQAQQRGARVETGCEVTGVEHRGQLRALQTTKGEVEADVLVVACEYRSCGGFSRSFP
jgi:glycine/D-amino acid oxidase-like deaminating enzyme